MSSFDDFKRYLPQYLSGTAQENLFKGLEDFPDNMDSRMYSDPPTEDPDVLQGDGLRSMLVIALPDERVGKGPVVVISNTCDTSFENTRSLEARLSYCPVLKLSSYTEKLRQLGWDGKRIDSHVAALRKQQISSVFFLPHGNRLPEDCVALLNQPINCDLKALPADVVKTSRLFSLSNYGFYLLLFKLSVHFTRIRESIDRDAAVA